MAPMSDWARLAPWRSAAAVATVAVAGACGRSERDMEGTAGGNGGSPEASVESPAGGAGGQSGADGTPDGGADAVPDADGDTAYADAADAPDEPLTDSDAAEAKADVDAEASPPLSCSVAISMGYTCARRANGSLWCWGWDYYGTMGDGPGSNDVCADPKKDCKFQPGPVSGLDGGAGPAVVQHAAGSVHACAVRTDGSVWCWGANDAGQLGDGTVGGWPCPGSPCKPTAVQVKGLPPAARVAVGGNFACALTQAGGVWCWGGNSAGMLGNGTTSDSAVPVPAAGLASGVQSVEAYVGTACALMKDGTARCWGYNQHGALGTGSDSPPSSAWPVEAKAVGGGIVKIWPGGCAMKTDGTLWCWGDNTYDQVGEGAASPGQVTPIQVKAVGTDVVDLVRSGHTCVLKKDGSVWCWGSRTMGELGDGLLPYATQKDASNIPPMSTPTPVQVIGFASGAIGIAGGSAHTCAWRADATLWCWGSNAFGQLGLGNISGEKCNDERPCHPKPVKAVISCP